MIHAHQAFLLSQQSVLLRGVELGNQLPGHEQLQTHAANIPHAPTLQGLCRAPELHIGLKPNFLSELIDIKTDCPGSLLVCGDFNLIYQAADKSNSRLNLCSMRQFRRTLDAMDVEEIYPHGRLYTWSNERPRPTMERLDQAFASLPWLEEFPDRRMRTLSTDWSDHAPLLMQLQTELWAKPRFRFEAFWVRLDGFEEVVAQAWGPTPGIWRNLQEPSSACNVPFPTILPLARSMTEHWPPPNMTR
jgi:hypothetical protein